jgi:hypothetical protein
MRFLRRLPIVPILLASPAFAAVDAQTPQPQADIELEEVLVRGRRPASTPERLTAWLSRLVGDFRYEGHVERRGGADLALDTAEVRGSSRCANLGAPGLVQCQMNVSWQVMGGPGDEQMPGGVSWLTPAVAVYGLYVAPPTGPDQAPESQYIGHMQVDSRGLAEIGLGQLFDDTLIYRASCADLPGNCQRVVQIEAPPDGKVIRMSVEVQRDSKLEARYIFQWHRTAQALAALDTPGPSATVNAGSSVMPGAVHNWAGKLVGKFLFAHISTTKLLPQECAHPASFQFICDTMSSDQECLSVGSGPGVRCIRDMGWQETNVPATRVLAGFELWGYDPVVQRVVTAIAYPASPMAIRNLGGMTFATGSLRSDTLTMTWLCPRGSACASPQTRIVIPPDGSHIRHISSNGNREVQRLTRVPKASAAPRRPR